MAMAEELGRITRPAAGNYQGRRKLLLAPLLPVLAPPDGIPDDSIPDDSILADGAAVIARYWEQVAVQVRAVQNALGRIRHIYHENLPAGGAEGIAYLEASGQGSLPLVRELTESSADDGAILEPTESMEIMAEILDWQRCLMQPLISPTVATRLQEWYADASRRRYEFIASAIDAGLGADETALLLINERHQAQFASDIEVIYIAPPALDEFRRWAHRWSESRQRDMPAAGDDADPDDASG